MHIIKTQHFQIAVNALGNVDAPKIAILLPGRLDTKDYANFVSHLKFLAGKGFYTIAIDPPGTWESPGDIKDYCTSTYVQAVHELIEHFDSRPTLLLGHSRGGATAMLASSNPVVSSVVVVNAAYGKPSMNGEKVENGVVRESRDTPPGDTRTKAQKLFDLPINYFEDGAKHDPKAALVKFKGPKLIVHATRDEFVSMERIRKIYAELSEPKQFLEIDCNHDYRLYPEVIQTVENSLGDFIDKFSL